MSFWYPPNQNQINSNTNPYRTLTIEQMRQKLHEGVGEDLAKRVKDKGTYLGKDKKFGRAFFEMGGFLYVIPKGKDGNYAQSLGSMEVKSNQKMVKGLVKEETTIDEEEKWIQKAIKKPGSLKKAMGVDPEEKIPAGELNALVKRLSKKAEGDKTLSDKERKLLQKANLAKTLKGFKKEEIELDEEYETVYRFGDRQKAEKFVSEVEKYTKMYSDVDRNGNAMVRHKSQHMSTIKSIAKKHGGKLDASMDLDEATIKVGDTVHLGHGTKGGTGVVGKVIKIQGGMVHIENENGDTFKGPMSRVSVKESIELDEEKFTSAQLSKLKQEYGKLKSVDPGSETYKKLTAFLDGLSTEQLKQMVDAKIPFLRGLALNRINRRKTKGESVETDGTFLVEGLRSAFKGGTKEINQFQAKLKELGMVKTYLNLVKNLRGKDSGYGIFAKEEDPGEEYTSRTSIGPSFSLSIEKVKGEKLGVEDVQKRGDTTYKRTLIVMKESIQEAAEKDHEYSMARSQLSTIEKAVMNLKKKMKGEGNLEAWVQSKLTKAADYIDSVSDHIDSGEHNIEEENLNENKFREVLNKGKKLGDWNMLSYFLYDGNVWMLQSGRAVNQGKLEDFKKKAQKGLLKSIGLDEETLDEVSPPGWEGTVKAMKKKKGDEKIENPWALAWWMKGKGYKSHYTKDGKKKD